MMASSPFRHAGVTSIAQKMPNELFENAGSRTNGLAQNECKSFGS